jgi:hypothetical protein
MRKTTTEEMIDEVVRTTLKERPPDATHWSLRILAAASNIFPGSLLAVPECLS